jgi:hypothetical protein
MSSTNTGIKMVFYNILLFRSSALAKLLSKGSNEDDLAVKIISFQRTFLTLTIL